MPEFYYAVIFTSKRTPAGEADYSRMAAAMEELARRQPGFLGIESARNADGTGITVSYWESEEAIANWKAQADHRIAQRHGKMDWYSTYSVRIARVEREYAKELPAMETSGRIV